MKRIGAIIMIINLILGIGVAFTDSGEHIWYIGIGSWFMLGLWLVVESEKDF